MKSLCDKITGNGNGMRISAWVWKMPEWNGMKWKISRLEWKTYILYFHTNSILHFGHNISELQKNICLYMLSSDKYNIHMEVFNIYFVLVNKSRNFDKYIAQTVYILHHSVSIRVYIAICSIDAIADKFDLFFFILRLTICQAIIFFLEPLSRKFNLLFHPCLSLIFLFLVFKLIVLLGVKAWYLYYGKCSFAVLLCQTL